MAMWSEVVLGCAVVARLGGVSDLHIPGRTFPVQQYFLEDLMEVRAAAAEAAAAAAAEEAPAAVEDQAEAEQAAAGDQMTGSILAGRDAPAENPGAATDSEAMDGATPSSTDSDSNNGIVGLRQVDIDALLQEQAELNRERMPPEGSAVAYGHKGKHLPDPHPSARQRLLGYEVGLAAPVSSSRAAGQWMHEAVVYCGYRGPRNGA